MSYSDEQLLTMPIAQVVALPGGNGLASPPIALARGLSGVIQWEHVERGVEQLVLNGAIYDRTSLRLNLLSLLWKPGTLRRVLMRPAPLQVTGDSLTSNSFKMQITLAVHYSVIDAVQITAESAPLMRFSDIVKSMILQYIRGYNSSDFRRDQGAMREDFKQILQAEPTLSRMINIMDVLVTNLSGDEALEESQRRLQAATAVQPLIDIEGQNAIQQSQYQLKIQQGQLALEQHVAEQEHRRQLELAALENQTKIQQTILTSLSSVAISGGDVKGVLENLAPLLGQNATPTTSQTPSAVSPQQLSASNGQDSLASRERATLESLRQPLGIEAYEILEQGGRVTGASIRFKGYTILYQCPADYPQTAPIVTIKWADGRTLQPPVVWLPQLSNIAMSLQAAMLHASQSSSPSQSSGTTDQGGQFNFGDEFNF